MFLLVCAVQGSNATYSVSMIDGAAVTQDNSLATGNHTNDSGEGNRVEQFDPELDDLLTSLLQDIQ